LGVREVPDAGAERLSMPANKKKEVMATKSKNIPAIVVNVVSLSILLSIGAGQAQAESTERVAFSEFIGYDTWQDVAVNQTEDGIKAILGNPVMINGY
jgi:hypothetical protein